MTKNELVAAIAKEANLTQKDAEKFLRAFIGCVSEELKAGRPIQLVGFGTFTTSKRAAREGVNPSTKEKITIPESTSVRFKPGKGLKDKVSGK